MKSNLRIILKCSLSSLSLNFTQSYTFNGKIKIEKILLWFNLAKKWLQTEVQLNVILYKNIIITSIHCSIKIMVAMVDTHFTTHYHITSIFLWASLHTNWILLSFNSTIFSYFSITISFNSFILSNSGVSRPNRSCCRRFSAFRRADKCQTYNFISWQ